MFDFPGAPSSGQVVTGPNGSAWKWDGTKWTAAVSGSGGGASITISDTPPASPTVGAMWFDSVSTQLYVWYLDPTGPGQWVVANNSGGAATLIASDTPPASPVAGSMWWDSLGGQLYLWFSDANSSQWVIANAASIGEAANDGRTYARRSQAWTDISPAVAAAPNAVGRNLIHNGAFNVWQRGPGPWTTTGTNTYTADRWKYYANLDTVSFAQTNLSDANRAAIGDEAANFALYNSFTGNAGAAANTYAMQNIEGLRRLAGKTVTLSFWAAAGAALKFGVSIAQLFGTGGSPSADLYPNGQSVTLSTTPTRYSLTFNIPSISGKTLGSNGNDSTLLMLWYSSGATNNALSGGVGAQSGAIWIWGVQLEYGSALTPLDYGGSFADQLRACQRYFQFFPINVGNYSSTGITMSPAAGSTNLAVPMRTTPTLVLSNQSYINASALTVTVDSQRYFPGVTVTAAGGWLASSNIALSADL